MPRIIDDANYINSFLSEWDENEIEAKELWLAVAILHNRPEMATLSSFDADEILRFHRGWQRRGDSSGSTRWYINKEYKELFKTTFNIK